MITFNKGDYIFELNRYALAYRDRLHTMMHRSSAMIDTGYAKDLMLELETFTALLRQEGINDMQLLHNDTVYARSMKEAYANFGEYCYDMLKQAFKATNDSLANNNLLTNKLQDMLATDKISINVASNYIAFNLFGKGPKLELTNFNRLTRYGLVYNVKYTQPTIDTTNVSESFDSKLATIVELSDVMRAVIDNSGAFYEAIDAWSAEVNDKLLDAKSKADIAWRATYEAYANNWLQLDLTKNNGATFCSLTVSKHKVSELLMRFGSIRRTDYDKDIAKVLYLDYINNLNIEFNDAD